MLPLASLLEIIDSGETQKTACVHLRDLPFSPHHNPVFLLHNFTSDCRANFLSRQDYYFFSMTNKIED